MYSVNRTSEWPGAHAPPEHAHKANDETQYEAESQAASATSTTQKRQQLLRHRTIQSTETNRAQRFTKDGLTEQVDLGGDAIRTAAAQHGLQTRKIEEIDNERAVVRRLEKHHAPCAIRTHQTGVVEREQLRGDVAAAQPVQTVACFAGEFTMN